MRAAAMLFAALIAVFSSGPFSIAVTSAQAETRTLSLYYTHTKESATVTFKRNGKYVPSGLKKLNRLLRDFRRNEPTRMDPELFDLVWEVYQKSGSRKPIHVISGYRSPRTNNMLRRRGRNVAKNSQHTKGKALDFFLPDVPVQKLRALGLQAHGGGVGYYRGSFVHLDTGRVRHWPRMSRRQLAKVFPKGRTIHVPSDGKPLKGFRVAKANLSKGLNYDGSRRGGGSSSRQTLIASLFQGKDEAPTPTPRRVAEAKPAPRKPAAPQRRAKPSGPDPFAMEVAAVRQQESQRDEEPAADGKIELPTKVAIPRARPGSVVQAPATQLASGPTPPAEIGTATTTQGSTTQLAYAAPSSEPTFRPSAVLRPRASVPGASEITGNVEDRQQKLKSRVQTALARQRQLAAEKAKENARLAQQIGSLRVPDVAETPAAPAGVEEKPKAVSVPAPSLRRSIAENGAIAHAPSKPARKQAPQQETQVAALPKSAPERVQKRSVEAEPVATKPAARPIISTSGSDMKGELALGDLDSDGVKQWAIAHSTRIGPIAALSAPDYDMVNARLIPSAVYPAGFSSQRLKTRADRFSGRALTKVAFARLPPS